MSKKRPFLPAKKEVAGLFWNLLLVVANAVLGLLMIVVLLLPLLLVPAGDRWPHVVARVALIAIYIRAVGMVIPLVASVLDWLFRGRASDQCLSGLLEQAKTQEEMRSDNVITAIVRNCGLLVFATATFFLVPFFLHYDGPDLKSNQNRNWVFVVAIRWCQANPNTTLTVAYILEFGAIVTFMTHVVRAWIRQRREGTSGHP